MMPPSPWSKVAVIDDPIWRPLGPSSRIESLRVTLSMFGLAAAYLMKPTPAGTVNV